MQIDVDFEKYGLDKFNCVYPPFLRYGLSAISLFFIIVALTLFIFDQPNELWELIFYLVLLSFGLLVGFCSYLLWTFKISLNKDGFAKKLFKDKVIAWDSIEETYQCISYNGITLLKLKTTNGKKIEIAGPINSLLRLEIF